MVLKQKTKAFVRLALKGIGYANRQRMAFRYRDERTKRIAYGPYLIPCEQRTVASYLTQRRRAFRLIVDSLERAGLDWGVLPGGPNDCYRILVRSSKCDAWQELSKIKGLPDALVAQDEDSSNLYLRLRNRLLSRGVGVLGAPRQLGEKMPGGQTLRFSLYARDSSCRAVIGPEAGVIVQFADPESDLAGRAPGIDSPMPAMRENGIREGVTVPFWTDAYQIQWPAFPIDVVYTWVDDADPHWQRAYRSVRDGVGPASDEAEAADSAGRFASSDELRYSLRSLAEYADWIRHVWIVTAGQKPGWLNDSKWITVIDHRDIFPDKTVLPTFNSHAIETCLHRVPGLSEHFLYMNDDVFIGSPVTPEHFFTVDGKPKVFVSESGKVPKGEPSPDELAPDNAAMNGRILVENLTSVRISYKYKHAPHALCKEIMTELERRCPDAISHTRASRFRRIGDVTLSGWLHHSFALATKRAVKAPISYRYIDLDMFDWQSEIKDLTRIRPVDVFCVNTVYSAPPGETLEAYLKECFPWPAPCEDSEQTHMDRPKSYDMVECATSETSGRNASSSTPGTFD